jgi:hypothetical protein
MGHLGDFQRLGPARNALGVTGNNRRHIIVGFD